MEIHGDAKTIASAFIKARGEMNSTVSKDAKGNFGKYVTLAAIVEATTAAFAAHGLAIVQEAGADEAGVTVATWLIHESGATMDFGILTLPLSDRKPQAVGSAITYGRRYALAAVCGLAPDDDDGQSAQDHNRTARPAQAVRPPSAQKPPNGTVAPTRTVDPTTGEITTPVAQQAAPLNPFDDPTPYYLHAWNRLTGKPYDLVKWIAVLHSKSDGPCTKKQYGYLTAIADQLSDGEHNYVLSVLCQSDISKANMCGAKVTEALLKVLPATKTGTDGVEYANPDYRPDMAEMVTAIATAQPESLVAA